MGLENYTEKRNGDAHTHVRIREAFRIAQLKSEVVDFEVVFDVVFKIIRLFDDFFNSRNILLSFLNDIVKERDRFVERPNNKINALFRDF
jgi:hypothetical protein